MIGKCCSDSHDPEISRWLDDGGFEPPCIYENQPRDAYEEFLEDSNQDNKRTAHQGEVDCWD